MNRLSLTRNILMLFLLLLVFGSITASNTLEELPENGADKKPYSDNERMLILENQQNLKLEHSIYVLIKKMASDDKFPSAISTDENAREITKAIINISNKYSIDPLFILGLIRVENPWLNPNIINWYGAVGLLQVVDSIHWGAYPECGIDTLTDTYTNICYGVNIYLEYLSQCNGYNNCALWKYNGCSKIRRSRNERCIKYPKWVNDYTDQFKEELY